MRRQREDRYNEDYFKEHNSFGHLTVLELEPITLDKHGWHRRFARCLCQCGKEIKVERHNLIRGMTKSCGCRRYPKGKDSHCWKGVGDLHSTRWSTIIAEAARRNIDVSITIEYAWKLFESQHGKCALSDEPLSFRTQSRKFNGSASLDRIDSTKGYHEGNVQWVHKDINMMKRAYSQERFIELCKKVSLKNS